ncbi:phosphoadenosine phosphosulfate reductase family protein [Actinomadura nitritigenes]|uniref:phosphoadenosine phosphosulfate reductase domain-containing protein n=1 Tax=Actinomadura nitritigenes TaxID=134602 RepID=UPI003D8FEBB5
MSRMGQRQSLDRITVDTDVYTLACERTAYVMDQFEKVFVWFSGGKDSTAVLNIALEVAHSDPRFERHLPLRAAFYDEEAIPFETEEYVRRTAQRDDVDLEWYCLPVKHRNACSRTSPYWWPWAPEAEEKWCRPLPPEAITTLPGFPIHPPEARLTAPDANGLFTPGRESTAMLMGIRAQESPIRRKAVTRRRVDNYIINYNGPTSRGNAWKVYPCYDWRTEDVWTAAALNEWDYNHAYDRMEMLGIGHSTQRCSPAFGEEPLTKIGMFAACFPEVWAKMAERVPGIGAAHRYALTELYGYGTRPAKPDGIPWPGFIVHYLEKFRPAEQVHVSRRINETIRRHYKVTTHPILPKSRHPQTGVSWDFLLTLAMRGDFKKRRQEMSSLDPDKKAHQWRGYAAELARVLADGVPPEELGHPRAFPHDPQSVIPDEYRHQ